MIDKDIVLEAKQITKKFMDVTVLSEVNLQVRKGEVLGLIGGNGAGKSTLLKILNGLYPHATFEGQIHIEGEPVKLSSPYDAQIKGIGFVPQETNVLESLSVAENIFVGNMKSNAKFGWFVSFKDINQKATQLLQQYNFLFEPEMKVRLLSIGSKQLLMIARALALKPKVLILDEPTTSLTLDEVTNLVQIVNTLKEKGTSIIFVTHKMQEIMNVCDRVVILRDGKTINTYPKEDFNEELIIKDMSGREIKNLYPQRAAAIKGEILKVRDLTVSDPKFKNKNTIEQISFSLREGEVLGIAGLTGSGRSEILNTLFGRNAYTKGEIWLNGAQVQIRNENDAMRLGFALVTEDRKKDGLLFLSPIRNNLTINNLASVSKWSLISDSSEKREAQSYFKMMNVKAASIETLVSTLSGGNQQKVIIGRSLNRNPRILLLDEPTKGIDVGAKNEIYQIINDLVEQGLSIILVSSDLPELLAMSDRCIVLANGQVMDEIDKKDATEERVMLAATRSAHF
ncbi:D-xylose transport system ATP-binding protein [Paenibacillus sp. 1_12]|uniref:sugar ABC transporter ATP-binding protein n=1 Tax=Paenibacillus sp. 1_12 TaxID=1566278 RepID=UPI0008E21DD9|nr:sugar ABC transporter ATP-binding protein [Paenibacillus sp. 1_12]SFL57868.1 D-xylose transport system ATP-binding protein [Paenibacillus sp. 1_12]